MGWSKKNNVWQLHRDPLASAGLIDWFDAGVGITLNSGNVSQWIPRVSGGSAHTLLQATAVNQPLYIQQCAHFANLPAVYFTDARYLRAIWGATQAQPLTYYVVAKIPQSPAYEILVDGIDASSRCTFYNFGNTTKLFAGSAEVGSATTDSAPCVYAVQFSGASSKIYRNDSIGSIAGGDPGSLPLKGLTLGIDNLTLAETSANSYLAELLVYSGTHDAATRKSIMDYLDGKYGIATT